MEDINSQNIMFKQFLEFHKGLTLKKKSKNSKYIFKSKKEIFERLTTRKKMKSLLKMRRIMRKSGLIQ